MHPPILIPRHEYSSRLIFPAPSHEPRSIQAGRELRSRISPRASFSPSNGTDYTPSTSWVSVRSVCVRASMQQPARKGNGATAEKYAVTERRLRSEDNHLQKERRNFLTTRIPTWKCVWRGGGINLGQDIYLYA